MKTKSKRFLNLATLCLALLGTTLLMARPVKASGGNELSSRSGQAITYNYEEEFEKGKKAGYLAGKRPGAPGDPAEDPEKDPKYKPDSENYNDGYTDGYENGYSMGWHETNDSGNSHNEGPQRSGSTQDKDTEESNDSSDGTPDQDQDKTVSDVINIIEELLTLVLSWFGFFE
ncbi:Uncharacterised protein [Streptococcus pyogenes]|uniref:hypothetical protein n=1 Tax=Streptococcus pyogenes TaxID=1314 RepID=UPI0010A1434C|nr:hypothetical protein [Streptococcus pyogenes]QCK24825.1 hypothetical protein ETT73_01945 [Streptococcus pyogenes]VGY24729.1 Uncharacterised protein [Streptococcus pyogenes]VGY61511.1 Uncharacterised protein [Streptococcus pyogenes]VGZ27479.1 Uncharacterised protein [Streptococcus pyogenes]VHA03013.1 Uncharacterised protein [Streptococcus pyogenes]